LNYTINFRENRGKKSQEKRENKVGKDERKRGKEKKGKERKEKGKRKRKRRIILKITKEGHLSWWLSF
jgi:hypothetical protein